MISKLFADHGFCYEIQLNKPPESPRTAELYLILVIILQHLDY